MKTTRYILSAGLGGGELGIWRYVGNEASLWLPSAFNRSWLPFGGKGGPDERLTKGIELTEDQVRKLYPDAIANKMKESKP